LKGNGIQVQSSRGKPLEYRQKSDKIARDASQEPLFIITLMASFPILQLRQAQDGNTSLRTSFVFSEEEIACMQDFLARFEGKTDRLKILTLLKI
jgi:hypothetical protein